MRRSLLMIDMLTWLNCEMKNLNWLPSMDDEMIAIKAHARSHGKDYKYDDY